MELNLTKDQRAKLLADLEEAEPYPQNAPELDTYDGEIDYARWRATMAKKFLEQDDEEKRRKGIK